MLILGMLMFGVSGWFFYDHSVDLNILYGLSFLVLSAICFASYSIMRSINTAAERLYHPLASINLALKTAIKSADEKDKTAVKTDSTKAD